jgi:hypothetical protein
MYRKFDVTGIFFLHSALFNGTKHSYMLMSAGIGVSGASVRGVRVGCLRLRFVQFLESGWT